MDFQKPRGHAAGPERWSGGRGEGEARLDAGEEARGPGGVPEGFLKISYGARDMGINPRKKNNTFPTFFFNLHFMFSLRSKIFLIHQK